MATINETPSTNGDIQDFTEAYAKSNWTFKGVPGNGSVDTKNLPSSIKITGSDNGQSQDPFTLPEFPKMALLFLTGVSPVMTTKNPLKLMVNLLLMIHLDTCWTENSTN
jgi:hypothetical protein